MVMSLLNSTRAPLGFGILVLITLVGLRFELARHMTCVQLYLFCIIANYAFPFFLYWVVLYVSVSDNEGEVREPCFFWVSTINKAVFVWNLEISFHL